MLFNLKVATANTAGIVMRYAGPAISTAVHNPVIIQPIGPVSTLAILVRAAFIANFNPVPKSAF